jgi:plasmid stability protein
MATMTLRDLPDDLHAWLKRQAEAHHRSVNKEVIVLLESVREAPTAARRRATVEEIMAISRRGATLPVRDRRSDDEILGYDANGVPG